MSGGNRRFVEPGGPHIRRDAGVDMPATGGISARKQRRLRKRDRGELEAATPLGQAKELRRKIDRDIGSATALGNMDERLKFERRLQAVDGDIRKLERAAQRRGAAGASAGRAVH